MKRILSLVLILSLLLGCMTGLARADDTPGKYVQDVFIAYGRTEAEARAWLTNNGWEPIQGNGDFCAGKESAFDSAIAAVMGIKRTNDPVQAVTDMAVMNMTGGYSFPDYETLLEKKKAEIDEFINLYMPAIQEYRRNYSGADNTPGKLRAEQAHALLNRFYDGGAGEPYAKNDTGLKLGDLLLAQTRQEGSLAGGDLQQIFLESSSAVVILIEQMLALASDTGTETWLERLSGLTGRDLAVNIGKYVPEAAGQNLAGSAINIFLRERFGNASRLIAAQWGDIHEEMLWYETYCDAYDLWAEEGESAESYTSRVDASFEQRRQDNMRLPKEQRIEEVRIDADRDRFDDAAILCENLYLAPYRGEWGDTLGDFFNPYSKKNYGTDADNFLTFAAAMSPGQRAALEMVSLRNLLLIGFAGAESLELARPDLDRLFGADETGEAPLALSVYTGINRGIFRGGVALTGRAEMDRHAGDADLYNELFDSLGLLSVASYAAAAVGLVTVAAGFAASIKGATWYRGFTETQLAEMRVKVDNAKAVATHRMTHEVYTTEETMAAQNQYNRLQEDLTAMENDNTRHLERLGTTGKVVMCIGAVIMIAAAFVKGYQLYKYYQRDFTPIPLMIVDESDIVTYSTDEEGNTVESINFDQFEYYQAVKCNRQQVGELSDWQSGVSDYASWGCGDAADLNGDFGQEWLALYTVKSPKKGSPILADSLVLQYGSNAAPRGCDGKLHKFTYTNAQDLGDTAYSFNNDKNGVYFFWASDAKAYDTSRTASAFTGGQLALFGAAGLFIGILGATLALYPKRKKEDSLLS